MASREVELILQSCDLLTIGTLIGFPSGGWLEGIAEGIWQCRERILDVAMTAQEAREKEKLERRLEAARQLLREHGELP